MEAEGRWLTIMDYAVKNDVSLSTIRRYIKSNKIPYRMEHGRYMLLDQSPGSAPTQTQAHGASAESRSMERRVDILEHRLNEALEQIAELKMLVAIYEEKLDH